MKIIDIHTHVGDLIMGGELTEPYHKVPITPGMIMELSGYRTSKPPPGMKRLARYLEVIHNHERNNMATFENLVKFSAPFGVTTSVIQPIEPTRKTAANLELVKSQSADPLKLFTFASIHPLDPDQESKLREYDRGGALGLKLHPIIQNLAPEAPAWMTTLELWQKTEKPVLVHAGVSAYFIPKSVRDTFGEAARYEGWIKAFPKIRFILAHMNMVGPEVVWGLAERYDNVYADASFQSAKKIQKARQRMGAHRVLYASDFPFSLPQYAVKTGMAATKDDPDFRRKFFHDNTAGLLGLEKGD